MKVNKCKSKETWDDNNKKCGKEKSPTCSERDEDNEGIIFKLIPESVYFKQNRYILVNRDDILPCLIHHFTSHHPYTPDYFLYY